MGTKIGKKFSRLTDSTYQALRKGLHSALHPAQEPSAPFFVFGLGRGGTTMVINILSLSLDTYVYKEGAPEAFNKYRLKSLEEIRYLVEKCRRKVVVFKPLQDSHRAGQILQQMGDAKAVWTYRHYHDLINSTLRSWGNWESGRRDLNLLYEGKGRFSEGISDDTFTFFKNHYQPDCRLEDAACLMWYVRNILYFEMNLEGNPRIALVNYERLVQSPTENFKKLFKFAGCEFKDSYAKKVFSSSVNKNAEPAISAPIKKRCQELNNRFQNLPQLS